MISHSSRAAATRRRSRGRSIAARYVALDARNVLAPGLIEWDAQGRIVSLRRARGAVADVAVLPGLVNAHAHLQIAALARPERRFMPWVRAVMAARSASKAKDHRQIALQGMRELLQSGTTAIGEIDSTGHTTGLLSRLPMAGRCYRELTGFDMPQSESRALVREVLPQDTATMLPGLSPHAPYSVSEDLMRAAAARTRHLAIHCAELPEEQEFLRTGGGVFRDLLSQLGRLPTDFRPPGCGAVRWLERLEVLRPTTQLVHCQELERGDVARIVAAGSSITVCPGTIEYFGRTPPPVPKWIRAGVPVALGTDSRASNTCLSMRRELARALRLWPELSPEQVFTMASKFGGRALNGPFGSLKRGRRADLVTVPAGASWEATLADFVSGVAPIEGVVLGGVARRIGYER